MRGCRYFLYHCRPCSPARREHMKNILDFEQPVFDLERKIEALEENVEWEQFKWGPNGVHIHGTFYPLARIHFMQKQEAA